MGAKLWGCSSAARDVFAAADRATGLPLAQVCFEGPPDMLTDTSFAQPGVVAVSLAAAAALEERLREEGRNCSPALCAGHSVGELAAFCFAGALELPDCLTLVAARGRLMAEASAAADGSMAAVLGLDEPSLIEVCARASEETAGHVEVANLNGPGQVVISGSRGALARAAELARGVGARRVINLEVSGPFHSIHMRPAAEGFRGPVNETPISTPKVPVVLNLTARPSTDPEEIRREMVAQVTGPVRWADTVRTMAEAGCTVFVELGPGQVLSGLIRRVAKESLVLNVEDEASLAGTVGKLKEVLGSEF